LPIRALSILGWLPPNFFTSSFAGQSLFNPLLFARLKIKGVFLSFFYDVFLQHLALKTPQCVFNRLAIMYLYMRHLKIGLHSDWLQQSTSVAGRRHHRHGRLDPGRRRPRNLCPLLRLRVAASGALHSL
jgi:hypothetical protein